MRRPIEITILIVFVGLTFSRPAAAQKYIGDFDPLGGQYSRQSEIWPTVWPVEAGPPRLTPPSKESPPSEEPSSKSETDSKTSEPRKEEQISKANDPDNSQHLQIQWEKWHRRVAEVISLRFDGVAQRAFAQSRPIACQASYTVTRDKQITNVRLLRKSNNIVFNSMLLMVLKSMNGNCVLEFPIGSKRESVEKTGEFAFKGDFSINGRDGFICDPPLEKQIQNTPTKNR